LAVSRALATGRRVAMAKRCPRVAGWPICCGKQHRIFAVDLSIRSRTIAPLMARADVRTCGGHPHLQLSAAQQVTKVGTSLGCVT
jgi:hypothetical protein